MSRKMVKCSGIVDKSDKNFLARDLDLIEVSTNF